MNAKKETGRNSTQKIAHEQLKKMLDESKIDGGDMMQTLAQELKKEGLFSCLAPKNQKPKFEC